MRILSMFNINDKQSNKNIMLVLFISYFVLLSNFKANVQAFTTSGTFQSPSKGLHVKAHHQKQQKHHQQSQYHQHGVAKTTFTSLFSTAATSGLFVSDLAQNKNDKSTAISPQPLTSAAVTTADVTNTSTNTANSQKMHPIKAKIVKTAMISYIASMCIALPATLYPVKFLHRIKALNTKQKEQLSCRVGCFCSKWLMRLIPFASVKVLTHHHHNEQNGQQPLPTSEPEPSIWVCNHTSMLDIFFLLAHDKKLRGKKKRPIKIIYWKDLEKNPVTKLLFTMSGFIPVEMEDNGNGNANSYNKKSFKTLLKNIKQAFEDGFDIGILPEGQLNPSPEEGLQPIFSGAYTLSKMSKRPIKMMALHGLHQLWHGNENIGMNVTGRQVKMRNYNVGGNFRNGDEFVQAFENVVGHFGSKGEDHPNWKEWLNGQALSTQNMSE